MARPILVLTGSSGFLGRRLCTHLCDRYRVHGIALRSRADAGVAEHPELVWHQIDIADRPNLIATLNAIAREGPIDTVIHLAAHYDFTGIEDREYHRTNVEGTRNVLDQAAYLGVRNFVFSSSLAACDYRRPGTVLDERSPANGIHVYARSKAEGEAMLAFFARRMRTITVRFAAMFSDWCEYPPLFVFLETWLSKAWNRRILAGHGRSAIPYLHARDALAFMDRLLACVDDLTPGEVLVASPDGCTSHEELFLSATLHEFGEHERPLHVPRALVPLGIRMQMLSGRLRGEPAFERPWMATYVDHRMEVDAHRTRERLGWAPRERLSIERRMPFLLAHRKSDPTQWWARNRARMMGDSLAPNLRLHELLLRHQEIISERFTAILTGPDTRHRFPTYNTIGAVDHRWNHRNILRQLLNAILTRERLVFLSYCQDLAERRRAEGYPAGEVCEAIEELGRLCVDVLHEDPQAQDVVAHLHQYVTMNVRFACDAIQERYEALYDGERFARRPF